MTRRFLIAGAVLIVGLPVAVVAIALAVANTDWWRGRIVDLVAAATADGPVQIDIGRLTGALPARIELSGVRLTDRSGEFAVLDRVGISWSPLALLGGTVSVQAI